MVWKLGHWKTKALKTFVKNFDPDILFIPIYPAVYMGWIQKYIINLTGKPTVCYLADATTPTIHARVFSSIFIVIGFVDR